MAPAPVRRSILDDLQVLCKFIPQAGPQFVTSVTINNNRQKPVEPWNLQAMDWIRPEIQDWLRHPPDICCQRQENAFETLSGEHREQGHSTVNGNAIELLKLAPPFLVSDGNIAAIPNMRRILEDERAYAEVFNSNRLRASLRSAVLCCRIQFRLRRRLDRIKVTEPNKYRFMDRATTLLWALPCQAVLNDLDAGTLGEAFDSDLSRKAQCTGHLKWLASTWRRPLLAALPSGPACAGKVADRNMSFLRTNAAGKQCVELAQEKWPLAPEAAPVTHATDVRSEARSRLRSCGLNSSSPFGLLRRGPAGRDGMAHHDRDGRGGFRRAALRPPRQSRWCEASAALVYDRMHRKCAPTRRLRIELGFPRHWERDALPRCPPYLPR